jgi:hypothetical protein
VVGEKRKTGIDGGAVVVGEQKTACVDGEAAMDDRWRRQRGCKMVRALFSLFLDGLKHYRTEWHSTNRVEPKAKGF